MPSYEGADVNLPELIAVYEAREKAGELDEVTRHTLRHLLLYEHLKDEAHRRHARDERRVLTLRALRGAIDACSLNSDG